MGRTQISIENARKRKWARILGAASLIALTAAAPALAQEAPPPQPQGAAGDSTSGTRFFVRAFEVHGNSVLPQNVVEDAVYGFEGPDRTPGDVDAARAALQRAYESRGYATVVVTIPEQSVASGIVRLDVAEQRIGRVTVVGATHSDPHRLLAQAPSLAAGSVPNFNAVQNDIVSLNTRADRRVTPELAPGQAPGTVDVTLNVKDSSPLHGSLEYNNQGSAATTDTRVSASLRYDDMFGRGDSLSLSAQTAPERHDDGTVYSGSYLAHLPGSRMQVLAYGVHSDSDISTVGGVNVIGRGDMIGLRLIAPLAAAGSLYQTLTFGVDYKNFEEDVLLGGDRSIAPIEYWPLLAQWRGDWLGDARHGDLTIGALWGFRGLGDNAAAFDFKRFDARPNFFALKIDGSVTQDLPHDLQFYGHASGQWAGEPLISNEEFSAGGLDTVRGYYEGELLGDYGLAAQVELRSPDLHHWFGAWMTEARAHIFADAGVVGLHEALPDTSDGDDIASAGFGFRMTALDHLHLNVDVAQPLMDGPDKVAGQTTARFRLWGDF